MIQNDAFVPYVFRDPKLPNIIECIYYISSEDKFVLIRAFYEDDQYGKHYSSYTIQPEHCNNVGYRTLLDENILCWRNVYEENW